MCAAPKGMVFDPFWYEDGYRLGLESGMAFEETTGVYERVYRFNSQ